MNDHNIDEQLQRFSTAVAHAAPDPLPLAESSTRQRFRQPALVMSFAFVAVMITLGLGALLVSWGRSSDASQDVAASGANAYSDMETYWDWLTTDAVPLKTDIVGVNQVGPGPTFDLSGYGEMQRLLSHAETPPESYRLVSEPLFVAPVAHMGTIEGTTTQVLLYRTSASADDQQLLCLEDRDVSGGGTVCYSDDDLLGEEFMWMVETGNGTSESVYRVSMAMLPRATAVVIVTFSDGRSFVQRPNGGTAAIQAPSLGSPFSVSIQALDQNGDVLASDTFTGAPEMESMILTPAEHQLLLVQCLLDAELDVVLDETGITFDNRVVDVAVFESTVERCDAGLIDVGYTLPGDPFVATTP